MVAVPVPIVAVAAVPLVASPAGTAEGAGLTLVIATMQQPRKQRRREGRRLATSPGLSRSDQRRRLPEDHLVHDWRVIVPADDLPLVDPPADVLWVGDDAIYQMQRHGPAFGIRLPA